MAFNALDLTQAYEADESSRFSLTTTDLTITSLAGSEIAWLHWDSAAPFGGSASGTTHSIRFIVNVSSTSTSNVLNLAGFASRPGTHNLLQGAGHGEPAIWLNWNESSGGAGLLSIREHDGTSMSSTSGAFDHVTGTDYYVTVEFDPALDTHGRVTVTIRTGSHAGSVTETITHSLGAAQPQWDYVLGAGSWGSSSEGGKTITATVTDYEVENVSVLDSSVIEGTASEEDFTTFTEVDTPGKVTVTASTITATNIDRSENYYVHRAEAALNDDWVYRGKWNVNVFNAFTLGFMLSLTQSAGTRQDVVDAGESAMLFGWRAPSVATSWGIYALEQDESTPASYDGAVALLEGVDYWVRISYERAGGGGNGRWIFAITRGHPDAVAIDSLTIDAFAQRNYSVIEALASYESGGGDFSTVQHARMLFASGASTTLAPTTPAPTTPTPTTSQPSGVLGGNITYGYFSSASGNASAGAVAWTTPEAAGEPDEGSYATAALDNQESQYLLITNPALGPFAIPAGAQITGIEIHVEAFATSVDPICIEAAIVKGGVISSTNVANNEIVGIYEYRGLYYGGQGEVFGESWSSTDFGSGFGIALRVSSPNAQTVSVDSAKVIIYWQKTPAATLNLVHAATPMAPCSIHADVLQSYIGSSSWEKVGVNWNITGPGGWEMLSTDPRPGSWGANRSRDCSTDMWGYSTAIFADVAGDYTIEATIYLEDGSTLVVSDVVTVAADTRAVRYLKDDGSDLADGTSLANAWATWEHAISQLTSNMRLVVQDDDSWSTTGSPSTNRSISSVDNVVIERSGDGLAKPVIEMIDSNAVFHISDLDDLVIDGIEILGNSDHTSPGDRITSNLVTSRITFANCDSSQGHNSWWESVGASGRTHVLIYNCLIEDVNRYGFYAAGSQGDRNHILIGTEFKSSSLRPPTGEGLVRFAGSGTSSTLGYGFNVLWCKFDANGQNHAGARSSASWSHIFQCDFGDSVLGISETADDIKLRLLYVKRYDGIYLNADNQTAPVTTPERNSLIYFCNSVIILGAPPGVGFSNPVKNGHYRYTTYAQNTFLLTFDSTGSQNAFKNTVGAANKATFAGIRIKGIVFAIVSPGATVNAYFMRDEVASPYSILDGGGSISECVTAKISLGDGRYIIRGTAYNTSAGANGEPGVDGLGISQADLDSEDLAVSHLNVSARNFLPPSGEFTDFETWCTPEPGVWVDYRGVLRDQDAVTWAVGATGLEDGPAFSAPATTPAPTTDVPITGGPTTPTSTTSAPSTVAPTTFAPTTSPPTTQGPTTPAPSTVPPTTSAPTTAGPTTPAPTTTAPTTTDPGRQSDLFGVSLSLVPIAGYPRSGRVRQSHDIRVGQRLERRGEIIPSDD